MCLKVNRIAIDVCVCGAVKSKTNATHDVVAAFRETGEGGNGRTRTTGRGGGGGGARARVAVTANETTTSSEVHFRNSVRYYRGR